MKISVIIPVYNGEKYITRCLNSIVNQSYQNIEIIIVNDGSTDKTLEIVTEYERKYKNVRVISKENAGLPQARKTGVINATGDYIGFVDVDDWVDTDMYAILVAACKKDLVDVVCCRISEEYEDGSFRYLGNSGKQIYSGKQALEEVFKRKNVFVYAWNKLIKSDLLKNIEYPMGNFVGEDFYIITQVLEKARNVVQIENVMYHYFQLPNSMSHGGYSESYILSYQNYKNRMLDIMKEHPEYKRDVYNYVQTEFMAYIIAMGKNETYDYDMIYEVKKFVKKNLMNYIFSKNIELKFKVSAIIILINYKLLIKAYKILK